MATLRASAMPSTSPWSLARIASFPGLRALAWNDDVLYSSCGYALFRGRISTTGMDVDWQPAGAYRPARWRTLTSSSRLSFRLFRDGFHVLAALPSGDVVAAVAGAIIGLPPAAREFRPTQCVLRRT